MSAQNESALNVNVQSENDRSESDPNENDPSGNVPSGSGLNGNANLNQREEILAGFLCSAFSIKRQAFREGSFS